MRDWGSDALNKQVSKLTKQCHKYRVLAQLLLSSLAAQSFLSWYAVVVSLCCFVTDVLVMRQYNKPCRSWGSLDCLYKQQGDCKAQWRIRVRYALCEIRKRLMGML
jgi:hypothetical protein